MEQISASNFPEVYKDLGIDTGHMGCIMVDTEPIILSGVIAEDDLYHSPTDEFEQGIVSETMPHITLLYGLLSSGPAMQKHVDAVLAGWSMQEVQIADVTAFGGADSEYAPLVARLVANEGLEQANARLRLLPHIDTFPDYTPHITLAYIKNDPEKVAAYVDDLTRRLALRVVRVLELNYGK